jgi:hypothetical protein
MTEAAHPGEDATTSSEWKGDPPAQAEQATAGTEGEKNKPDSGADARKPVIAGQQLSLAKAFEEFKEGELVTSTGIKATIPKAVKQWVNGKIEESDLELSLSYEDDDGNRLITAEATIDGVYTYKDPEDQSKYIYAPPQLTVSEVVADLVKESPELKTLFNSVFGFDLTLRKITAKFHTFKTTHKDGSIDEQGTYISLAIYTDKKPETRIETDDKTVLDTPNGSTEYSIESPTDAPEIDDKPFCIIGIGEDTRQADKKQKWGHFALSLRAILQANAEFQKGQKPEDNQGDSWAISLPLVNSLLPGSGRLIFGNPFVSFSQNLNAAPSFYLEEAVRFLKKKDPDKTNTNKFNKTDYVLPKGGKARVGVGLKFGDEESMLLFEYPSADNAESGATLHPYNENTKPDSNNAKPDKDDDDNSETGLQKYGSVLNPGLVRIGPFTLYKMGLGLETIERTDPSNIDIKSKKLCLVLQPGLRIGSTPQKGKGHGFIDITDLKITIPVGGEQENQAADQPPPRLISPVQFEFNGMAIELSKGDSFLLRGAAYFEHSTKAITATGEVLFRLGSESDPKLLITIMMGFWLDQVKKKWGFYIYGMAVFRVTRVPLDPVLTQTYLTGFALGVGINYLLTIPDINTIETFPLIKALFGTDVTKQPESPKDAIQDMEAYLQPKSGYFWMALGAEISTLETFRGFFLVIGIAGSTEDDVTWEACLLAVLVMTDPQSKVYKIEIVFKLLIAWYGLKAEFLITGRSFIFDKQLTITGSGYLWTYWAGEYEGETIFVLGGYHPDYNIPTYFPNPTPIILSYERKFGPVKFKLGGEAYFAISNKVVMFGISLWASAEVDIIWEWKLWANLSVDVLLFWSPFSLKASAWLEVGIRSVVKIWFIRVPIELRLSLELKFWKPGENSDLGGVFIFEVLAWTVKARFGSTEKPILPITWKQFIADLGLGDKEEANPLMIKVGNMETMQTAGARLNDVPWLPTEAERADQATDYAIADRLSSEPVLKATSAIPFKELKVAGSPVMNGENGQRWNTQFGIVPCFQTKEALNSTLSIACKTADKFDFIPDINTMELPYNVWSPELLSKPNIKEAGIANTLMGAWVRPSPRLLKTGNKIGPFTTEDLIRYIKRFAWPTVPLPARLPANTIKMADFKKHINHNNINSKRNALLKALKVQQPELYSSVDLKNTAEHADKVLVATPVVHTLGY